MDLWSPLPGCQRHNHGTILLVNWHGSSPIAPDYRKARYALLLEILQRWQGTSAIEVYDVSVLAERLGVDFGDENLIVAIDIRRQKAAENPGASNNLQIPDSLLIPAADEHPLSLSGWGGVLLFDQRPGYHVQLALVSGKEERLRLEEANSDLLSEYTIHIEDIKDPHGLLDINVNLITPGDAQIGDWLTIRGVTRKS